MQNLPVTITAAPPVTSTQAPTPTDNGAAQAAEPFGSVLARQRANAGAPADDQKPDSKKADSKPSSAANDAPATVTGNDPAAPIADAASTLSGDMLAALLPATAVTNSPAAKEKTSPQAPTPDGVSTLPSDMLALLLPAAAATAATAVATATATTAAATNRTAVNEKGLPEAITDGGKKTRSQPIVAAVPGEIRQAAGNKAASGAPGISEVPGTPGASVPSRAQGNTRPEAAVAVANVAKDGSFSAALETLGKDGATKISKQPVAPAALDSLLQSGIAPIATSSSSSAQIVQAAINTPVTHEAWGNEFNQKITWMATQHEQTAELHLNPPNLGPLDVVLKVSGDQATALFTSPHAAVRDAVEQALPRLRDMLADNGITLGNAMVSDQSPKDQQAWQASQQQKGNRGTTIDATVAIGSIPSGATASLGRRHQGMVDTFA